MERIKLSNGKVKLTSANGVKDTRDGSIYSEAIIKESDARFFVDVE